MPYVDRGAAKIWYEEQGTGFPVLTLAPGGMRSTVAFWEHAAINPLAAYAGQYRLIAMDQRNAGSSTGPLDLDDPWGSYAADQLAVMDHLGIDRFLVFGCCIGGPFILKLIELAPERVVAAVLEQPVGIIPRGEENSNRELFDNLWKTWREQLLDKRDDLTSEEIEAFAVKMWAPDFAVSVTRDQIRSFQTPMLVLPGVDEPHPTRTGREIAELAPNAEKFEPWKDDEHLPAATEAAGAFLREHAILCPQRCGPLLAIIASKGPRYRGSFRILVEYIGIYTKCSSSRIGDRDSGMPGGVPGAAARPGQPPRPGQASPAGRIADRVRECDSHQCDERFSPMARETREARQAREAVIVEAVRTPIGKRNGSLAKEHAADLSGLVLRELAQRTGIDPAEVDDVIWGCVGQVGDQSSNIGRYGVLAAGWPETVPGTTINRACGSSQQALEFAFAGVISGAYDIVVAGGVEVMSRVPLGSTRQDGFPYGPRVMERYDNFEFNQGAGAELIAERYGLDRQRLDEYSSRSHELAARAIDNGAFGDQVVPVKTDDATFAVDEGLRRGTTPEKLARLKPSFSDDGVIHAGNSSQISDGAAGLLVMTEQKAKDLGLTPIVRFHTGAVSGADPITMLLGPIPATQKLLKRSGVTPEEIGAFEVNEAFAPVPLAWQQEIGAPDDRLNPLGGAIAVGHPLGASGAVLMTRLINHMRDNGLRYGLQTMCEGGGTANATLVELVA